MPHQTEMKNLAIAADILIGPSYIANRHETGVNVLYGDGSAHWVLMSDFQNPAWLTITHDDFGPEHDDCLLNTKVDPATGVWAVLDQHINN